MYLSIEMANMGCDSDVHDTVAVRISSGEHDQAELPVIKCGQQLDQEATRNPVGQPDRSE